MTCVIVGQIKSKL